MTPLRRRLWRANKVTSRSKAHEHRTVLGSSRLAQIEGEIAELDQKLRTINQPRTYSHSLDDLRSFFFEKAREFGSVLTGDVETARGALAKHIRELTLTPKETVNGRVYEVSGDIELFDPDQDGQVVCSTNGGQGRNRSVLPTSFSVAIDGMVLYPGSTN